MRSALCVAILVLGVVAAGCSDKAPAPAVTTAESTATGPAASPSQAPNARQADGPAAFDEQRTLAHIEALSKTIGPRVSGTDGEARAASYIADQFRSDGYDVEILSFTFDGDRFRGGSLVAGGKSYEALTMSGSPGGSVSGSAVFVGVADAEGLAGRDLAGKVAISDRGVLKFGEKYQAVRDAGAVALVVLNNQPGIISGDLREEARFPVVMVSGEDAPALRAAAAAGSTVTVVAPDPKVSTALNVLARPARGATCRVIVGGHHDTVPSTGGANDNASGAAEVVELARAFAADGIDGGLCFATFGAEESGLYGSAALVKRFQAEGQLPALMVNLDVAGIGSVVNVIGDPSYRQKALDVAQSLGIPAQASSLPANSGSDHQSFQQVGVPVLYLESGDFATIHTPADVVANIQVAELKRIGDVAFAAIKQLLPEIARAQGPA
jgi:Iap family predicted aminopeptidase